jgi:hypothetical protein
VFKHEDLDHLELPRHDGAVAGSDESGFSGLPGTTYLIPPLELRMMSPEPLSPEPP